MILLDSNILISTFNAHEPSLKFLEEILKRDSAGVSLVTVTEIYAGMAKTERTKIKNSFSDLTLVPFDDPEIAELAADYKADLGLKTPDAIIAATCEFHGSEFYTYDQDFKKIKKSWVRVLKFER